MDKIYLKFPSGRLFQLLDDIGQVNKEKKFYILFTDEEKLKTNFDIDARATQEGCRCFYAAPTKIGAKNITRDENSQYVVFCGSQQNRDFLAAQLKEKGSALNPGADYLVLSEDHPTRGPVIEMESGLCPCFEIFILDGFYPVCYSPFSYHTMDYARGDGPAELLSLGDERDFTVAHLDGGKISVSPNFGEISSFNQIEEMDKMVSSIMGQQHNRNIPLVTDYNNYSTLANYSRRFSQVRHVNHIFSHMAAAMYDNGFTKEKGIGIIYDSTSYSESDEIQGSEIVYGSIGEMEIIGRWKPVPLPGGDIANIEPWRIALAAIKESIKGDIAGLDIPLVRSIKGNQNYKYIFDAINNGNISYTLSSSMHHILAAIGELFDFRESTLDFEHFENQMDKNLIEQYSGDPYKLPITESDGVLQADTYELFNKIVGDIFANIGSDAAGSSLIFKSFHTIAHTTAELAEKLSKKYREKKIFLSGEFFKRPHFLSALYRELKQKKLDVYVHKTIPVDDSAISLGQILFHCRETPES